MTKKNSQVSEVELRYRNRVKAKDRPAVTSSGEAHAILRQHWNENRIELVEQAKMLLLNRASQVLGICDLSSGGLTGTVMDPRHVFATALKANACAIIIAHNHPSGNLKPSVMDERLTDKLRQGGKLLDVALLDHLILTADGYYSITEERAYTGEDIESGTPQSIPYMG